MPGDVQRPVVRVRGTEPARRVPWSPDTNIAIGYDTEHVFDSRSGRCNCWRIKRGHQGTPGFFEMGNYLFAKSFPDHFIQVPGPNICPGQVSSGIEARNSCHGIQHRSEQSPNQGSLRGS